jgi:hypothetical protein
LGLSHLDVLGELLSVELGEAAEDVEEHAPGGRGQVEALGHGVHRHAVLLEQFRQSDEVFEVSGQPVESPQQDVVDVSGFDHGDQALESGPVGVLAGCAGVFDDGDVAEVMEIGVGGQLRCLAVDRVALGCLFLGRHSAVRNGHHGQVLSLVDVASPAGSAGRSGRARRRHARGRVRGSSPGLFGCSLGDAIGE